MSAINPYVLPTINFVGGSSQELLFHVYFHNPKNPFNLTKCTANFSVIDYVNKTSLPLINKSMTVIIGAQDYDGISIPNILKVALVPADTVNLTGKFIYQISVKEGTGAIDIPSQGIIYIANNANKKFVTE